MGQQLSVTFDKNNLFIDENADKAGGRAARPNKYFNDTVYLFFYSQLVQHFFHRIQRKHGELSKL